MKHNGHYFAVNILWVSVILLFARCEGVAGSPLRLTVQPRGTNQVELTLNPVDQGGVYEVLARINGPEGHWVTFAGLFLSNSNKVITATRDLGGIPGLTL